MTTCLSLQGRHHRHHDVSQVDREWQLVHQRVDRQDALLRICLASSRVGARTNARGRRGRRKIDNASILRSLVNSPSLITPEHVAIERWAGGRQVSSRLSSAANAIDRTGGNPSILSFFGSGPCTRIAFVAPVSVHLLILTLIDHRRPPQLHKLDL